MTSNARGDHFYMRTRMCIISTVLVGALAYSAPALAQQSPTKSAYGGVIAEVVTPKKSTTPKPPQQTVQAQQQAPSSGSLPFTGLQVTLVLLAGAALLGGGLALRRAT